MAHHAYDAWNGRVATLRITDVLWDSEGWPYRGDERP
jgi:hypothetical protein